MSFEEAVLALTSGRKVADASTGIVGYDRGARLQSESENSERPLNLRTSPTRFSMVRSLQLFENIRDRVNFLDFCFYAN